MSNFTLKITEILSPAGCEPETNSVICLGDPVSVERIVVACHVQTQTALHMLLNSALHLPFVYSFIFRKSFLLVGEALDMGFLWEIRSSSRSNWSIPHLFTPQVIDPLALMFISRGKRTAEDAEEPRQNVWNSARGHDRTLGSSSNDAALAALPVESRTSSRLSRVSSCTLKHLYSG